MCDPNGFPASWRSCTRRQAILTSPKATSLSRWRGGAGAAKPKEYTTGGAVLPFVATADDAFDGRETRERKGKS